MVFSGVAPASARGSQGGSLVLVGAGSQHGHTDTGLQLWVTRFQDSQAKSFKTQDNFATVNAAESGEGEEKGGGKQLLMIHLTKLPPYHRSWNEFGSALASLQLTQEMPK